MDELDLRTVVRPPIGLSDSPVAYANEAGFGSSVVSLASLVAGLFSLLLSLSATAAPQISPLFASQDTLAIELEGPFSRVNSERDKSKRYDGFVWLEDSLGGRIKIAANFEVRGNWRLKKESCRYSQLWVDLKKDQVSGTVFEGQNRLKLVAQCSKQRSYSQFLLKEKLAYDLYSHFTDYHFKTRLLNVTYTDSEKEGASYSYLGFFIEHPNRLAARVEMREVVENTVDITQLDSLQANRLALFMYLIGNTDYSVIQGPVNEACCHNAELLVNQAGNMIPFPFDFDNSGFVDASYAAGPSPNVGLRSTKQRLFRGHCAHLDTLDEAIAGALSTKLAVLDAINQAEGLSSSSKRASTKFVDDYYEILASPDAIQTQLVEQCRL